MKKLANIEMFEQLGNGGCSSSDLSVFNAPRYSQLHDSYVRGLSDIKTKIRRLCNECCEWIESGSGTLPNDNGFLAYFDKQAAEIAGDASGLSEDILSWGDRVLDYFRR